MLEIFKDSRYLDVSYYFKFHKYLMRFLGYWPGDPPSARALLVFALGILFELFFVLFEMNFAFHNYIDLAIVLDSLTGITPKMVTVFKLLIIIYNRKEVSEMLLILKNYFEEGTDEVSRKINSTLCKLNYWFLLLLLGFSGLCGSGYLIIPLIKDLLLYLDEKPMERGVPFKSLFPDAFHATELPSYIFLYLGSGFSGFLTVFGLSAVDGLFLGLCFHISGQFQIIEKRLNCLMAPYKSTETCTEEENRDIFNELSKIIEHHQVIVNLSKSLSSTYVIIVLLHFLSGSITICICCITILMADGFDKLTYINYLGAASAQALVYAIGGQILDDTSFSIKQAAYQTDWYKCNEKIKKTLLLLMLRAGKPSGIDVPFIQVSMETFSTIMYTSSSYITILNKFL